MQHLFLQAGYGLQILSMNTVPYAAPERGHRIIPVIVTVETMNPLKQQFDFDALPFMDIYFKRGVNITFE
ncbi:hypothetical protein D3C81_2161260 [compost metagenome]